MFMVKQTKHTILKKVGSTFLAAGIVVQALGPGLISIASANSDQVLTAPQPGFVENKIQWDYSDQLNKVLLGRNLDNGNYTAVIQSMSFDRNEIGGFTFKLQRTTELQTGKTPEKIKVELFENGNLIATNLLDGVSSFGSPEEVTWKFPNGLKVTPNSNLELRISVDSSAFNSVAIGDGNTHTFPYYVIGTDDVKQRPAGLNFMSFYDGDTTSTTNSLLGLSVLRKASEDLDLSLGTVYKFPKLEALKQGEEWLQNISDIKVVSMSGKNRDNVCNDLPGYRLISEKEFETMASYSQYLFSDAGNTPFDAFKNSTTDLEIVTKGAVFTVDPAALLKEKKFYKAKNDNQQLSGDKGRAICVFEETHNIIGADVKKVDVKQNTGLAATGLNMNTERYLTPKTQVARSYVIDAKNPTLKNIGKIEFGDVVKVFGKVKTGASGFVTANGIVNNKGDRVGNFMYQVGNDSSVVQGGEFNLVNNKGDFSIGINDEDGDASNNEGAFTVVVEPLVSTNSIRNDNNLFVNTRKNIEGIKYDIGTLDGANTYTSIYQENKFIPAEKVVTYGFDNVSEKQFGNAFHGADALTVDGSYIYVVKGNKLTLLGTGLNQTTDADNVTYTLNKDLTGIHTLVSVQGQLYAGYSSIGLSDRMAKITLKSGNIAEVTEIKLEKGMLDVANGDIDGKKSEKTNYVLASDGINIYSISYLKGSKTATEQPFNGEEDAGYRIRVFSPANNMSVIRDSFVPALRDNEGKVVEQLTYYTEGAFVDENYIYILQKKENDTKAKVVAVDKNTFRFNNTFELDTFFDQCSQKGNACPKGGAWNPMMDEFVMLSSKDNVGKANFFKSLKDSKTLIKIPKTVELDYERKEKKYAISYQMSYANFSPREVSYREYNDKEEVNGGQEIVSLGYEFANKNLRFLIGDTIVNKSSKIENKTAVGGLYRLYRTTGNSNQRINNKGFDSFQILQGAANGGQMQPLEFHKSFETISRVKRGIYEMFGEKNEDSIVTGVRYYFPSDKSRYLVGELILRNDGKTEKKYNTSLEFGENFQGTVSDSRGNSAFSIGKTEGKYVVIDDTTTDDKVFFGVNPDENMLTNLNTKGFGVNGAVAWYHNDKVGQHVKLGYDGTTRKISVNATDITLKPNEEITIPFYVGSLSDGENIGSYYKRFIVDKDVTEYEIGHFSNQYSDSYRLNPTYEDLELSVGKSNKTVTPGVGSGVNNLYNNFSSNASTLQAFNRDFNNNSDLESAGMKADGWKHNLWQNKNGMLCSNIAGAGGSDKTATLELHKYYPEDTQISFKIKGRTDSEEDKFYFFIGTRPVLTEAYTSDVDKTVTFTVPKGGHVLRWQYIKNNTQATGGDIDNVCIDDLNVNRVLSLSERKPYNDKIGTNFVFPGFKMKISNENLTQGAGTNGELVDGKVKVIPLENDTVIEVRMYDKNTGAEVGTVRKMHSNKIGQTIDFSVSDAYTYKVTSNKVVSILMSNFYENIGNNNALADDNSPAYDSQNGSEFVVYMPGNKVKKGDLYISANNDKPDSDDVEIKIEDLTNNRTNFTGAIQSLGKEMGPAGPMHTIVSPGGNSYVNPDEGETTENQPVLFDVLANDRNKYLNTSPITLNGFASPSGANAMIIEEDGKVSYYINKGHAFDYGRYGGIDFAVGVEEVLDNFISQPCYIKTNGRVSCLLSGPKKVLPTNKKETLKEIAEKYLIRDGFYSSSIPTNWEGEEKWGSYLFWKKYNGWMYESIHELKNHTTWEWKNYPEITELEVPEVRDVVKLMDKYILTMDGNLYYHNADNSVTKIREKIADISYIEKYATEQTYYTGIARTKTFVNWTGDVYSSEKFDLPGDISKSAKKIPIEFLNAACEQDWWKYSPQAGLDYNTLAEYSHSFGTIQLYFRIPKGKYENIFQEGAYYEITKDFHNKQIYNRFSSGVNKCGKYSFPEKDAFYKEDKELINFFNEAIVLKKLENIIFNQHYYWFDNLIADITRWKRYEFANNKDISIWDFLPERRNQTEKWFIITDENGESFFIWPNWETKIFTKNPIQKVYTSEKWWGAYAYRSNNGNSYIRIYHSTPIKNNDGEYRNFFFRDPKTNQNSTKSYWYSYWDYNYDYFSEKVFSVVENKVEEYKVPFTNIKKIIVLDNKVWGNQFNTEYYPQLDIKTINVLLENWDLFSLQTFGDGNNFWKDFFENKENYKLLRTWIKDINSSHYIDSVGVHYSYDLRHSEWMLPDDKNINKYGNRRRYYYYNWGSYNTIFKNDWAYFLLQEKATGDEVFMENISVTNNGKIRRGWFYSSEYAIRDIFWWIYHRYWGWGYSFFLRREQCHPRKTSNYGKKGNIYNTENWLSLDFPTFWSSDYYDDYCISNVNYYFDFNIPSTIRWEWLDNYKIWLVSYNQDSYPLDYRIEQDYKNPTVKKLSGGYITNVIESFTQPQNGVVDIYDGKLRYKPNFGFSGVDTFTYTTPLGTTTVTVTVKPFRTSNFLQYPDIGEGQILRITAFKKGSNHAVDPREVSIYYGLGDSPAMTELLSADASTYRYPVRTNSFTDHRTHGYSYYDKNSMTSSNWEGNILFSGVRDAGQGFTNTPTSYLDAGKWGKALGKGPIGLAVGNISSSKDYTYSVKSTDKIYGIGTSYVVSTLLDNPKLVVVNDDIEQSQVAQGSVELVLKNLADNTTIDIGTIPSKGTKTISIQPNVPYKIEHKNPINAQNKNFYVYVQQGDNVRNTFTTVFKSRNNEKLGDQTIKKTLDDTFVKYEAIGDFDYIKDTPLETGNINTTSVVVNSEDGSRQSILSEKGDDREQTKVELESNEKLVINGENTTFAPSDELRKSYSLIEAPESMIKTNGTWAHKNQYTKTTEDVWDGYHRYGLIAGNVGQLDSYERLGGGYNNTPGLGKTGNKRTIKLGMTNSGWENGGPGALWKKYSAQTQLPTLNWEPASKYVKENNVYAVKFEGNTFLKNRQAQSNGVASIAKPETTGLTATQQLTLTTKFPTNHTNTNNLGDSYGVNLIKNSSTAIEDIEINRETTLSTQIQNDGRLVFCLQIEDNNNKLKNLCLTSLDTDTIKNTITNGATINELSVAGKNVKALPITFKAGGIDTSNEIVNINITENYNKVFTDGTRPVKLKGLEISTLNKKVVGSPYVNTNGTHYVKVFGTSIKNYTSPETKIGYEVNKNIISPETPASHNITLGKLELTNGTTIFNPQTTQVILTNGKNNVDKGYNNSTQLRTIVDEDKSVFDANEAVLNGNIDFQIEGNSQYIVKFNARGGGDKTVNITGQTSNKNYLASNFTPVNITGNSTSDGQDLGDEFTFSFQTGKWESEQVRMSLISNGGDLGIGEAKIYKFDNSQLVEPNSADIIGKYTTGELPVTNFEHLPFLQKGENIWKIHMFSRTNSNPIPNVTDITTPAKMDELLKNPLMKSYETHPNQVREEGKPEGLLAGFTRSIKYVPDSQTITPYNYNNMQKISDGWLIVGSTTIFGPTDGSFTRNYDMKIAIHNGYLKVNGEVKYSSLSDETKGCITTTGGYRANYPGYNVNDSIVENACNVTLTLNPGPNYIEFVSLLPPGSNKYKGFYKNTLFQDLEVTQLAESQQEVLTFDRNNGSVLPATSFLHYNTTTNDHLVTSGNSITIGKANGSNTTVVNPIKLNRDYSENYTPSFLAERVNYSYYDGPMSRILQQGYKKPSVNVTAQNGASNPAHPLNASIHGTYLGDKQAVNSNFSNVCVDFPSESIAYGDTLETYLTFRRDGVTGNTPEEMENGNKFFFSVELYKNNSEKPHVVNFLPQKWNWNVLNNINPQADYQSNRNMGASLTPIAGYIGEDMFFNQRYKLLIPLKYSDIYKKEKLSKVCYNTYAITPERPGGARLELGDMSILHEYTGTKTHGNNVKIVADVENVDNNKNGLTFHIGGSLNKQTDGYTVEFSKNNAETCIYRDGVLLGSCANTEDSKFKPNVNKYKIAIVKTGWQIGVLIQYNDIGKDGKYGLISKEVLKVKDPSPNSLNIVDSKLFISTTNGKHKLSNVKVTNGDEDNVMTMLKVDAYSETPLTGKIRLFNDYGEVSEKEVTIPASDKVMSHYFSISDLPSFRGRVTDIIFTPDIFATNNSKSFFVQEISLVSENDTPNIITENTDNEIIGNVVIKKDGDVVTVFENNKLFIMGYTIFVKKLNNSSFGEGILMRMYPVNADGSIDYNTLIAEKLASVDSIDSISPKPLKITFPSVGVVKGKKYALVFSTTNQNNGLQVYGTVRNSYIKGYSDSITKVSPETNGFEFNTASQVSRATKGGYINKLSIIDNFIGTGENKSFKPSYTDGAWLPRTEPGLDDTNAQGNMKFFPKHQRMSYIAKVNLPTVNSWSRASIISDYYGGTNHKYDFYVARNGTTSSLNLDLSLTGLQGNQGICSISIPGDYTGENTLALTQDIVLGRYKFYKNGNLVSAFQFSKDGSIATNSNITLLDGTAPNISGNCSIAQPFDSNTNNFPKQYKLMFSNTQFDRSIDFFRVYHSILSDSEVRAFGKPDQKSDINIPHDIALYAISKNDTSDSVEERTYDLGEGIVREVDGDLYLDGYDSGNGVKELLLKGNITFRVKGNIYINADKIYVLNDNSKQGDKAISYIGFIADKDIIINSNTTHFEGGYFAQGSVKTIPSDKQLKLKGSIAANEIDFQNRTYMGENYNPNDPKTHEDSVILEFDNRVYKRMPPLFYQTKDKKGIDIQER